MKTETIRTITIEDFKSDPHLIDYVDENLIILDSVENSTDLHQRKQSRLQQRSQKASFFGYSL